MDLKDQLEIIRGEPIQVFDGDPMDIPCIETSDAENLCKNPVVSVHMITYNHEPFIRQAIEGVMMQKTDFEFELIIGEDASQDKTREICLEYQKKYPDKIRVLWWHENLYKIDGNSRRVTARCRGEFIAFCEGDDYWTDPLKLQKQVDVMRTHLSVGICFAHIKIAYQDTGLILEEKDRALEIGLISGTEFSKMCLFGDIIGKEYPNASRRTLSALIRKDVFIAAKEKYKEVFSMALRLGDTTCWLGCSGIGDVYLLEDVIGVYRVHSGGVTNMLKGGLLSDGIIVRIYFMITQWGFSLGECIKIFRNHIFLSRILGCEYLSSAEQKLKYKKIKNDQDFIGFSGFRFLGYLICLKFGVLGLLSKRICDVIFYHIKFKSRIFEKKILDKINSYSTDKKIGVL